MKLAINFVVHSCVADRFAATATVAGKEKTVTVDGLVIELVSEDGSMSQTIRVDPDDLEGAFAAYKVGAIVKATYTVAEPK